MCTKLVKCICFAVLFFTFVFWSIISDYEFPVRVVVCAGAAVVAVQAFRAASHRWTAAFLLIVFLYNPAIPVFRLASGFGLLVIVLAAISFAVSLTALRSQPRLSVLSITGRNSGESL